MRIHRQWPGAGRPSGRLDHAFAVFDMKASMPPILHTDRLILRPHVIADSADEAALWADPVVTRHILPNPATPEESWSRLLRYIGHWQALGYGYWAVTDLQTGAFLGEAGGILCDDAFTLNMRGHTQ